ncbi:head-tail adaptor protein [Patescibacteria group bacterium]|nr:head-tail adaptor protein [Patescibacteria group bacterium]
MPISNGLFIETFYPQTLTSVDDGQGGVIESWADDTAFRGRLSSLPVSERMSADKLTVYASHKLFCDYQTLTEAQRIRNSDSTRYFQIKGIVSPSNMNHHLEVTLLELD